MSYQKLVAVGNLGRDPETIYSQSGGAPVCKFSIACGEKWKNKKTGEWEEKTEWINCVAFARLAEVCGEFLKKGSKVLIEGKLQTSNWEKDGQKHYRTEINLREMQMLDSRSTAPATNAPATRSKTPAMPPPAVVDDDDFDDDIPF